MYMHVCACVHICLYIYIYTNIYARMHTHAYIHSHFEYQLCPKAFNLNKYEFLKIIHIHIF